MPSSFTYRPRYRYALSQRNRMSSRSRWSRARRAAYTPPRFGTTYPNALYKTSMPGSMTVKMKYCDQYSLTSGSGTATSQVFKANSVYDPDHSGTGHQASTRDQWALLYTHYRVDAVHFKVVAIVASGSGFLTMFPSTDGGAITDPVVATESRLSTTIPIQGGGGGKTLSRSYSLAAIFGVTRQVLMDDDLYRSVLTADPQAVGYLRLSWIDAALSAGTVCHVNIEITYSVTLYGPLQTARA